LALALPQVQTDPDITRRGLRLPALLPVTTPLRAAGLKTAPPEAMSFQGTLRVKEGNSSGDRP